MAYTKNYIYFAIPSGLSVSYIKFPSKSLALSSGTRLGASATYSLPSDASGGTTLYVVYKFSYSSNSNNINVDNMASAWLDYVSGTYSSYTARRYSTYAIHKFWNTTTSDYNTTLYNAIKNAGDSQYDSLNIYLFSASPIDSTYDGTYEEWRVGSSSYTKEFKRRNYYSGVVKNTTQNVGPATYPTVLIDLNATGGSLQCGLYSNASATNSTLIDLDGTYIKGYVFSTGSHTGNATVTNNSSVYALHKTYKSTSGSYYAAYVGATGTGSSTTDCYARFLYGHGSEETWCTLDDNWRNNRRYFSITSQHESTAPRWVGTSISLSAGYKYTFKLHTYSESGAEGIVIRSTSINSTPSTWSAAKSGATTFCTGMHSEQTYTTTPSSNGTLYIYYYIDSNSYVGPVTSTYNKSSHSFVKTDAGYTYGDVMVTRSIPVTLNKNGGTGGTDSVYATNDSAMPSITIPTRAGGNGNFSFMGYWDTSSTTGGTQYYNATGGSVRNWDKTGTSATLYARWRNSLIYTRTATDFNIYTSTNSDTTSTTTVGTRDIELFSTLTCPTVSVTLVSLIAQNDDDGSFVSGWTFSTSTRKLTVPAGTSPGLYQVDVYLSTPSSTSTYPYVGEQQVIDFWVSVIKTAASEYSSITGLTYEQLNDFPAGSFTLSQSNLSTYFRGKGAYYNQLYNNGYSEPSTSDIEYTFIGAIASGSQTQSYTSLATTPTSRSTVSINQNYVIILARHGSSSQTVTITSAYREANTITNSNYSPSNYTASVTIGNGMTAAGGSATVSASASHKAYDYYTSGSYNNQHNVTDSVTWSITSNGNSRFTKSGSSISHSDMTTNASTDTVVVTAVNGASSAATGTSSKSITNSVTLTMTLGSNTITYNGETTVTVAASYSSGSIETDVTSSASMSLQPAGIVIIS